MKKNPKVGLALKRRRQKGVISLLEVSLVAIVGSGLMVVYATDEVSKRIDSNVKSQAMALKGPALGALNQYLTERYSELTKPNGGVIAGVANPLRPTIAELRALGMLKDPLQNTAYNGGNYRIVVTQYPAGCVAPNCNLDAILYIDRPITNWRGDIDYARLGLAVGTIGDDGALSSSTAPATFTGRAGKWSTPNPAGSVAGLLAARTGYNSAMFSQFYRRDGSLPITGDIAASGFNINNAGQVNANKVNLPSGESVQIGAAKIYGDGANAAIRSPSGWTYLQDAAGNQGGVSAANGQFAGTVSAAAVSASSMSATNASATNSSVSYQSVWGDQTVYGTQAVNGAFIARNMVYLPAMAYEGYGCSGNGITTQPDGKLLSCQSGVWRGTTSSAGLHSVTWQWGGSGGMDRVPMICYYRAGAPGVYGGVGALSTDNRAGSVPFHSSSLSFAGVVYQQTDGYACPPGTDWIEGVAIASGGGGGGG